MFAAIHTAWEFFLYCHEHFRVKTDWPKIEADGGEAMRHMYCGNRTVARNAKLKASVRSDC